MVVYNPRVESASMALIPFIGGWFPVSKRIRVIDS